MFGMCSTYQTRTIIDMLRTADFFTSYTSMKNENFGKLTMKIQIHEFGTNAASPFPLNLIDRFQWKQSSKNNSWDRITKTPAVRIASEYRLR